MSGSDIIVLKKSAFIVVGDTSYERNVIVNNRFICQAVHFGPVVENALP